MKEIFCQLWPFIWPGLSSLLIPGLVSYWVSMRLYRIKATKNLKRESLKEIHDLEKSAKKHWQRGSYEDEAENCIDIQGDLKFLGSSINELTTESNMSKKNKKKIMAALSNFRQCATLNFESENRKILKLDDRRLKKISDSANELQRLISDLC